VNSEDLTVFLKNSLTISNPCTLGQNGAAHMLGQYVELTLSWVMYCIETAPGPARSWLVTAVMVAGARALVVETTALSWKWTNLSKYVPI